MAYGKYDNHRGPSSQGGQPKGANAKAASPAVIDSPFYNPYTFIPFPETAPRRCKPTPLTIDEIERDRFTGVIRLSVTTCSPLLSCAPEGVPSKQNEKHKIYSALQIGNDVIVPATGIRGSLRTMLSAIMGGTLGYMDENLWLCQGRDATLGPATPKNRKPPEYVFLGRVIEPGNAHKPGKIQLGQTKLVKAEFLEKQLKRRLDDIRPQTGKKLAEIWIDQPDDPYSISETCTEKCPWQVKLSGRPVSTKGHKKEGAFLADGPIIEIPPSLWNDYSGRNRNADFSELRKGYLVWLEPMRTAQEKIASAADIRSLQWARWGRHGRSFKELLMAHHKHLIPDSMNTDGWVDEVTNLFGQVPLVEGAASAFAARVTPTNLVFKDGVKALEKAVTLAPLMQPHPGCVGFYHDYWLDNDDASELDDINQSGSLRGYKVYRNTTDRGDKAPWLYKNQPIYRDVNPQPGESSCNKSCDLLKEGQVGEFELACRGLSRRELAMLVLVCEVCSDWHLGGGKPLGLGHCKITSVHVVDEFGKEVVLDDDLCEILDEDVFLRAERYSKSQEPVPNMRYPRAVKSGGKATKAGHIWFARHAAPRKQSDPAEVARGLQTMWTDAGLKQKVNGASQIRAQPLPLITDEDTQLYGYDCGTKDHKEDDGRTLVAEINPSLGNVEGARQHESNRGQNAGSRQAERDVRLEKH